MNRNTVLVVDDEKNYIDLVEIILRGMNDVGLIKFWVEKGHSLDNIESSIKDYNITHLITDFIMTPDLHGIIIIEKALELDISAKNILLVSSADA